MTGQLLKFPAPTPATQPTPPPRNDKVTLHDGDLVLYKRDSVKGTWQYRITLPDGSYERRTTGERDFERAKKVGSDRLLEVRWREERNLSVRAATFDQAADSYIDGLKREAALDGRQLYKKDEKKIQLIVNHLLPHFAGVALGAIDGRAVAKFHDDHLARWEQAKQQPQTVSRKLRKPGADTRVIAFKRPNRMIKRPGPNGRAYYDWLIKTIIDHAVSQGMATRAEVNEFEPTKVEKKRRGGFTNSEKAKLLEHLERRIDTRSVHHRAMRKMLWLWARLNLLCGTRPGDECNTLRFKDFTFVPGAKPKYVVRVRQGKTGSRPVVADAALGDVLDALKADHPDPTPDAVIWQNAHVASADSCNGAFFRVLRELGMDKDDEGRNRTSYSLRHTYISDALSRGVDIMLVSKNCGTSVTMIQKVYDHSSHLDRADELLK